MSEEEPAEESQSMEGVIVFSLRFVGSKSERPWPHLAGKCGELHPLMHEDDDSFSHASLRPFHRKFVRITCKADPEREDQLLVTDVVEAADPFSQEEAESPEETG